MKLQKIIAIITIIILIGLYAATLIFAILDSPYTMTFFKASLFCTVVIPCMLYGYMLIIKYFNNKPKK